MQKRLNRVFAMLLCLLMLVGLLPTAAFAGGEEELQNEITSVDNDTTEVANLLKNEGTEDSSDSILDEEPVFSVENAVEAIKPLLAEETKDIDSFNTYLAKLKDDQFAALYNYLKSLESDDGKALFGAFVANLDEVQLERIPKDIIEEQPRSEAEDSEPEKLELENSETEESSFDVDTAVEDVIALLEQEDYDGFNAYLDALSDEQLISLYKCLAALEGDDVVIFDSFISFMGGEQYDRIYALLYSGKKMMTKSMMTLNAPLTSINGMSATGISYDENGTADDYYKLISKRDWKIAPGVDETEIVLNNSAGTYRQVVHTAKIDLNNPYTKVIPGYKGMIPQAGNYGTESTSTQALNAEKLGYGNVVVATNALLSWYNEDYYKKEHPELVGEPLGYSILDGYYYSNSRGQTGGMSGGASNGQVVINYDVHPTTGETRPANMPKVLMRNCGDPLTGWEQYSFSVWQWLVKPNAQGVPTNQCGKDHTSAESRTWIGITADGEIILSVCDGGQAPYSSGLSLYEEADYMIKMGAVYAANCDGGGSTTFCSQRPGEDLKVNCSLADGGERPTTNTILVISTAPADGAFANATITSEYDYYTPSSTVEFSVLATDTVGTKVDVPPDVQWTVKQADMGTVSNGVFTSSGKEGLATVQLIYNGDVVGERTINIATPDDLKFEQPVVTIPFGKTVDIPAVATYGNGLFKIGVGANDIIYQIDNPDLGTFDGSKFVAVDEENAPENLVGNVTATLNMGSKPTATVQFRLGKGSEILWGFENGQSDVDEWNVINNRTGTAWAYDLDLSLATRENGQVHDGDYSMRLVTNGLHSKDSHSEQYAYVRLGVDGDARVLENARSVGFWLYVPEDNIQCWVQGHYRYDSTGDGNLNATATVNMMDSENVYYNIDESGWHYLEMDVSAYSKIALAYSQKFAIGDGTNGEFFIDIVFHKAINNILWQTNGSINGQYTYYLDNFTVDYSEAVDDREEPIIGKIYLDGTTPLIKRDVVTTNNNVLNLSAEIADATVKKDAEKVEHPLTNISGIDAASAKVYIDGVEIDSAIVNGKLTASVSVADGYHRVKFEVCDNAGNKAVVIRVVKVESGVDASTLQLVPADATLDRIPFGSIYWMNLEANKIETIQSVSMTVDLNNVNHWQLDHMELAYGFTANYSIAAETNTAYITITRTGANDETGNAVLAKLPVRILDFDNDMRIPGYTAVTVWTQFTFWPQDMKMDVDKGEITFVDGYESNVLNAFSNEEFHVDTEMYTHKAGMTGVDNEYWVSHGSTHVHTLGTAENKAPTCTECGYEGRVFCTVCGSPVEWGTTLPATGHTYVLKDGKFVCSADGCEKEYKIGTGLFQMNGKNYYAISGSLVKGWQQVGEDDWYYFDDNTYEGINGKHTFNGIEFDFEDGLVEGVWKTSSAGTRYYYGPSYYYCVGRSQTSNFIFKTIKGKTYAFDRKGYRYEGYAVLTDSGAAATLYQFTDDGVLIGEAGLNDYTGIFHCKKTTTYLKNGVPIHAGLVKDGNDYYYIASDCNAVVGNYDVTMPNDLLIPGFYQFGPDGKMINPPIYEDGPNVNSYFYLDGVSLKAYQLVEFEGYYYYIDDGSRYAKNRRVYIEPSFLEGTGLPAGVYEFDTVGRMVIKNGPNEDGYFYLNNVRQEAYQLIEYEGYYYLIYNANKYAKNICLYVTETMAAGTDILAGYYDFDAEGRLIIKNGPNADGYFYLNNVRQKAYQLVEYENNYYLIYDAHKYAKSARLYVTDAMSAGTGITAGYYEFDTEGKMIINNGPNADGYFYLNNVRQSAYKLVEFEGDYYLIYDAHKYAKNARLYVTAAMAGETGWAAGYYEFDAEGKMIIKNGPNADGYFYLNNVRQSAYKVVEYEGSYYLIYNAHKYAKSARLYVTAAMAGETGWAAGYYEFDAEGKMIIKNGPNADGYFYLNNVRQSAYKVVEYEGNYYLIYDAHKYAKSARLYVTAAMAEGTGLPAGYYDIDAEGRLAVKNGPNEDGYFYLKNVRQKAYKLVEYKGNYYLIYDAHKYAKNARLYVTAAMAEGTGLSAGYYEFDAEGKMIIKNGPNDDGYFYLNGVRQSAYKLVEYEGSYYLIYNAHKYAKSAHIYITEAMAEGTGFLAGYYDFDAEGKLIIKNGPNEDGYFYLNGLRQSAYQLIKYDGNYYYLGKNGKYITSVWQYTGMPDSVFNGTEVRNWHHSFDPEGKMIGYYEGLPNGRDIGDIWNLKTTDGKDIKSGLLIRGCELDLANYYYPEDMIAIGIDRLQNEFHVKTDMDLRKITEVGQDVLDSEVTHKIYDMVLYNDAFTAEGKAKVKEVFTDLADPDNYPIYMHCTHGTDRTGTVGFFLEAVLGVSYQMCVYEYTLSVNSYGQRIVDVYNQLMSSYSGATLRDKAEAYLKDCGITQAQIDSLREIYLEG